MLRQPAISYSQIHDRHSNRTWMLSPKEGGKMMTHFESTEWLDLARGAASPEATTKMQKHLETGCDKCAEMAAEMNKIAQMSKREPLYAPPQETLRMAKSLMA